MDFSRTLDGPGQGRPGKFKMCRGSNARSLNAVGGLQIHKKCRAMVD